MLSVIILSVIMLSVIMMTLIMLNVVMLNIITLSVIILSVVAPFFSPRGTIHLAKFNKGLKTCLSFSIHICLVYVIDASPL